MIETYSLLTSSQIFEVENTDLVIIRQICPYFSGHKSEDLSFALEFCSKSLDWDAFIGIDILHINQDQY